MRSIAFSDFRTAKRSVAFRSTFWTVEVNSFSKAVSIASVFSSFSLNLSIDRGLFGSVAPHKSCSSFSTLVRFCGVAPPSAFAFKMSLPVSTCAATPLTSLTDSSSRYTSDPSAVSQLNYSFHPLIVCDHGGVVFIDCIAQGGVIGPCVEHASFCIAHILFQRPHVQS
eukprot:GEMP01069460.1.p1 GENE.GEMP01069460.1~~GEMP01069460.1.p1  ORF type:complete len:168 (-),score=12.38 GEMP01069460.1:310-813(-)